MSENETDRAGATPILVLGMHRGGTSALAGVLQRLGFDLGSTLMEAAQGVNDKGFFEHLDAFRIHERLLAALGRSRFDPREMPAGWQEHPAFRIAVDEVRALIERDFSHSTYWAVKDPRLCRLAPVWLAASSALGIEPRVILIVRHPLEVARSMQAQHWVVSAARSHLCWLQHMLEAERATRGLKRSLVVYDDLLSDWRGARARIGEDLDLEWPEAVSGCDADVDAFLDASERHFDVANLPASDAGPEIPQLALDVIAACRDRDEKTRAWQRIAEIGESYALGAAAFGPCLDEAIVEASLAAFEIGQGRLAMPLAAEGASARFDAIDAALDGLAARLAQHEELATTQSTAATQLAEALDRMRALGETLSAMQQETGAAASVSAESSRRHADDMRALRETLAGMIVEIERLSTAAESRFSLRKLFGAAPEA